MLAIEGFSLGVGPKQHAKTLIAIILEPLNLPFRPSTSKTLTVADIVHLNMPMALVGVWRSDENDAGSEYHVQVQDGRLLVSAKDYVDGDHYVVSNLLRDPQRVEFDTFMASTIADGPCHPDRNQFP